MPIEFSAKIRYHSQSLGCIEEKGVGIMFTAGFLGLTAPKSWHRALLLIINANPSYASPITHNLL